MSDLLKINSLASHAAVFSQSASQLGFDSVGEIDRFLFSGYGKTVRQIPTADRLRSAMFVLEPASVSDALGTPPNLKPLLAKIQNQTTAVVYSVRADLVGGLKLLYTFTSADRNSLVNSGWTMQTAQQFSRVNNKCVIWALGVGATVFINGDIYLESVDVVEGFGVGPPSHFQSLSWDDGAIMFSFADTDLNDTGPVGVWHLPDKHLLRPKPETLMRDRLGRFLTYRLAGYVQHYEEAHVENEGRADISLHLIDGRILIVEIKWLGCSLVSTKIGETVDAIKAALTKNATGWTTKFKDDTIASGVRQLVRYYKTGKYRRAYLAIFDCAATAAALGNGNLTAAPTDLDGHSPENFCILRACVDPRSASRRAKA
jgi:hypothetical protein